MSNVRSVPVRAGSGGWDWEKIALRLGRVALWLGLVAFGTPFFAVNGGFSVRGLGQLCAVFNDEGRLMWEAISLWQFTVPARVPGLPATQPVIPWVGVVAASILQVVGLWLKLSGKEVPGWMVAAVAVFSAYDLITTFLGVGTITWVMRAGLVVQTVLAILLTFGLELTIGTLLPRLRARQ